MEIDGGVGISHWSGGAYVLHSALFKTPGSRKGSLILGVKTVDYNAGDWAFRDGFGLSGSSVPRPLFLEHRVGLMALLVSQLFRIPKVFLIDGTFVFQSPSFWVDFGAIPWPW